MRTVNSLVVLCFELRYSCELLKPKVDSNILPMSMVCYNCSLWDGYLLTLAFKTGGMCHGTVSSLVIPQTEVGDLGLVSM
jgi:hypothetical protein